MRPHLFKKNISAFQKEEEKWTKAESRLIEDLSIQKEKMYKIPKIMPFA